MAIGEAKRQESHSESHADYMPAAVLNPSFTLGMHPTSNPAKTIY
jgi:hypothetical protein